MNEDIPENNLNLDTDKKNFISNPLFSKKLILLTLTTLLILAILSAGIIYYRNYTLKIPKTSTLPIPPIPIKTLDLTKGLITEIKDPAVNTYVEQGMAACDFEKLSQTFGIFVVPGKSSAPIQNEKRKSAYGETTWWFGIQGEVIEATEVKDGIKYVLSKDNERLVILATKQTTILMEEDFSFSGAKTKTKSSTASAVQRIRKINTALLGTKEKAIFYLTMKCGGGKNPLLLVDVVQKIPFFIEENKLNQ